MNFRARKRLPLNWTKPHPEDTQVQNGYLPALGGLAAIGGKDPQRAIDLLQANSAYEFGVPPLDFNTYFGGTGVRNILWGRMVSCAAIVKRRKWAGFQPAGAFIVGNEHPALACGDIQDFVVRQNLKAASRALLMAITG